MANISPQYREKPRPGVSRLRLFEACERIRRPWRAAIAGIVYRIKRPEVMALEKIKA